MLSYCRHVAIITRPIPIWTRVRIFDGQKLHRPSAIRNLWTYYFQPEQNNNGLVLVLPKHILKKHGVNHWNTSIGSSPLSLISSKEYPEQSKEKKGPRVPQWSRRRIGKLSFSVGLLLSNPRFGRTLCTLDLPSFTTLLLARFSELSQLPPFQYVVTLCVRPHSDINANADAYHTQPYLAYTSSRA